MNRIGKKFLELKSSHKKALIPFITAGYPNLKKTAELIHAMESNGADLIEIGVPFSDPLADGPVIQESSRLSLKSGTSLKKILALISEVRKKTQIPILLMSYLNPILSFDIQKFCREAKKSGVDGVIIPDLPPDEGRRIAGLMSKSGIDLVYLLAPTSDLARVKRVVRASRGFVYYVSITGVTGSKNPLAGTISKNIIRAKKESPLPVCVGFGISNPEQARSAARTADGVIVGSALMKELLRNPGISASAFARKYLKPFSRALGKKIQ